MKCDGGRKEGGREGGDHFVIKIRLHKVLQLLRQYFEITAPTQANLLLPLPLPNFKPNRLLPTTTSFKVLNVKCRIADDRKTTSSNTRKIAIAMSVAEMEAGEVDDLIRVPFSGPSGSTFRDYK